MNYTISQKIRFSGVSSDKLYRIYLNDKQHSLACGGKANIQAKVGSKFNSWDGYITGKNLHLIPGNTIVQTWRSADFLDSDKDSILILNFTQDGRDGMILMTHTCIPEHQYKELKKGWTNYYWKPWKKFLSI